MLFYYLKLFLPLQYSSPLPLLSSRTTVQGCVLWHLGSGKGRVAED